MTWTHVPHSRCFKPIFGVLNPHGSIWACDVCGKRWMVDKTPGPGGERRTRWVDLTLASLLKSVALAQSKEPADVARRELAGARLWFEHHLNGVYADLGLERTKEASHAQAYSMTAEVVVELDCVGDSSVVHERGEWDACPKCFPVDDGGQA